LPWGYPVGWIDKWEFFRRKEVAGAGHVLTEGTWHVEAGVLAPFANFPGYGLAPPSLRVQIEALEFAAEHIGERLRLRRAERDEHARRLKAAAATLKQIERGP
jgi:hypothetical protein